MPTLTRTQKAQLYVATAAHVHGALMHSRTYRTRPQAAAHLARDHADAAVREVKPPVKRSRE